MAKKNYLVEGVSGSGKTSVCRELGRRGYPVINGDNELEYHGDPKTGESVKESGHHTWIWDVEKVKALISDKSNGVMFFCGGSRNFESFIDLFDGVFVLDADDETIKHRLATRPGDKWGKKQEELDLVLRLNQTKEDMPSKATVIDATKPLGWVVDQILEHSQT